MKASLSFIVCLFALAPALGSEEALLREMQGTEMTSRSMGSSSHTGEQVHPEPVASAGNGDGPSVVSLHHPVESLHPEPAPFRNSEEAGRLYQDGDGPAEVYLPTNQRNPNAPWATGQVNANPFGRPVVRRPVVRPEPGPPPPSLRGSFNERAYDEPGSPERSLPHGFVGGSPLQDAVDAEIREIRASRASTGDRPSTGGGQMRGSFGP